GYSIAFGHGTPWWGGLAWLGFKGVGLEPDAAYGATIPLQAHAMFQLMFAIITPALISGAVVERMRFRAYVVFLLLWATFVYDPLAHWVRGSGGSPPSRSRTPTPPPQPRWWRGCASTCCAPERRPRWVPPPASWSASSASRRRRATSPRRPHSPWARWRRS